MGRRVLKSKYLLILIAVILSVLQSCSLVLPVIAPFKDLPPPTGPYFVATRITVWTDSSRDETFTPKPDHRRMVVQVWYPVREKKQNTPIFYVDNPALRLPALAEQLRLPVSLIRHFDQVKTNAYLDVKDQNFETTFPVILFSHGLSGMRFQNSSLMEELASRGYVVFAADHSYEANITIFQDGEVAEYKVGKRRTLTAERLEEIDLSQLSIIVKDMSFMIDQFMQNSQDPFLRKLPMDTDKLGVIGHSLGGAAIINLAAEDSRVDAAMALDAWYIPVPDSVVTGGLDKPLFHLGQKDWSDPGNYERMDQLMTNCRGPVLKLLLPGTCHADYTDMPLFSPFSLYIGYTRVAEPDWLNDLIRQTTVSYFDTYLKQGSVTELTALIKSEKAASSYIFIPHKQVIHFN